MSSFQKFTSWGSKLGRVTQAEGNSSAAKIGPTMQRYFQERLAETIPYRCKPGITYAVYNYESDFNGAYTYFMGEEVPAGGQLPAGLERYVIPAQAYTKFTTDLGEAHAVKGILNSTIAGSRLSKRCCGSVCRDKNTLYVELKDLTSKLIELSNF